jgi:hypothetical protein
MGHISQPVDTKHNMTYLTFMTIMTLAACNLFESPVVIGTLTHLFKKFFITVTPVNPG